MEHFDKKEPNVASKQTKSVVVRTPEELAKSRAKSIAEALTEEETRDLLISQGTFLEKLLGYATNGLEFSSLFCLGMSIGVFMMFMEISLWMVFGPILIYLAFAGWKNKKLPELGQAIFFSLGFAPASFFAGIIPYVSGEVIFPIFTQCALISAVLAVPALWLDHKKVAPKVKVLLLAREVKRIGEALGSTFKQIADDAKSGSELLVDGLNRKSAELQKRLVESLQRKRNELASLERITEPTSVQKRKISALSQQITEMENRLVRVSHQTAITAEKLSEFGNGCEDLSIRGEEIELSAAQVKATKEIAEASDNLEVTGAIADAALSSETKALALPDISSEEQQLIASSAQKELLALPESTAQGQGENHVQEGNILFIMVRKALPSPPSDTNPDGDDCEVDDPPPDPSPK
ncbi:MAG: hypothetical protein WC797_00225 [Candidatus Paceibacterota bacterium]|jgi:hypothetical protein